MSVVAQSSARYRRSPYCLLHWEGPTLVVRNADSLRRFRGAERYVDVLHALAEWTTVGELAGRLGVDEATAARGLARLVGMGLVAELAAGQVENGRLPSGAPDWDVLDLALQRQTARGGYDPTRARPSPPPAPFKPAPASEPIALRRSGIDDSRSLRDVLESRRSIRAYGDGPLPLAALETFLYSSARVVRTGHDPVLGGYSLRPTPSGGARHPLEIYPVCNAVDGLDGGAYWYHPLEHALYPVRPADEHQAAINAQVRAATGGVLDRDPPVVLLITAVFERTMWKYDEIGLALILKDVGALYQTLYLVATAMGLAPCGIGGGPEAENAAWLGLDPLVESQVGCFLLGPRQGPP